MERHKLPLADKIALVDMDGTVADHHKSLIAELEKMASPGEPPIPENPHEGPPWLDARLQAIHSMSKFWNDLEPIPLGFSVVGILQDIGYEVHVLTKGPHKATAAWTEKRDWCHQHFPPGTPVTITEEKGIVFGDVLFDDFPPYIERWLRRNPNGKVIMLDWHYNRHYNPPQALRISDPEDMDKLYDWLA